MKYARCIAICIAILFSVFMLLFAGSDTISIYKNTDALDDSVLGSLLFLFMGVLLMAGLMIVPSVKFIYKIVMFIVIVFALCQVVRLINNIGAYYEYNLSYLS